MKPGATTLPAASMVRLRGAAERLPMAAIFPSRMPRSPEYHGEPVPSMMWPLVMTRSKAGAWSLGERDIGDAQQYEAQQRRGIEEALCMIHSSTIVSRWIMKCSSQG